MRLTQRYLMPSYALRIGDETCSRKGARIFELSPVVSVEPIGGSSSTPAGAVAAPRYRVTAKGGTVSAAHVVVCGSAYMPSIPGVEAIKRAILPVMTYVSVTEPLGEQRLAEVLRGPHAVTGTRAVCLPVPVGHILLDRPAFALAGPLL